MATTVLFFISAVLITLFLAVRLLDGGASFLFAFFIGASAGVLSVYILVTIFVFIKKKIKSIHSSKNDK